MTDLLLVRHGQASFGSANYDRLSPTGRRQAEVLGIHWRHIGWTVDAAVSGRMQRQIDTGALALGADIAISQDGAFDEYDSRALLQQYGDLERMGAHELSDGRRFQQHLEQALRRWIADCNSSGRCAEFESWDEFNARVRAGLQRLIKDAAADERRVVFTSAGAIACALAQVLGLDGEGFIALNRRVLNASVSQLTYGRNGFALIGFNDVSAQRLVDAVLVTYR